MFECKVCKVLKVRENTGRKYRRSFIKLDEKGRQWIGAVCPPCNSNLIVKRTAERRAKVSGPKYTFERDDDAGGSLGSATVLNPPKQRPCRTCSKPSSNYYDCPSCLAFKQSLYPDTYFGCLEEDMYGLVL